MFRWLPPVRHRSFLRRPRQPHCRRARHHRYCWHSPCAGYPLAATFRNVTPSNNAGICCRKLNDRRLSITSFQSRFSRPATSSPLHPTYRRAKTPRHSQPQKIFRQQNLSIWRKISGSWRCTQTNLGAVKPSIIRHRLSHATAAIPFFQPCALFATASVIP